MVLELRTVTEQRQLRQLLADYQSTALREANRLETAKRAPNAVAMMHRAASFCADMLERMETK